MSLADPKTVLYYRETSNTPEPDKIPISNNYGKVDEWITPFFEYNVKSSDFNCVPRTYYIVDTSNGIVTATLPNNPTNFDYIGFADLKGTFDTNNLIITIPSGATYTIMGLSENMNVDVKNASFELVYYNGDWRVK